MDKPAIAKIETNMGGSFATLGKGQDVAWAERDRIPSDLGTDVALLNGLMHIILKEELWDKQFVAERTEDFEELKETIAKYPPELVSEITGLSVAQLEQAARMYAAQGRHAIYHGMGITHYTNGTDRVKCIAHLAMLCGKVGVEGGGCNPLRGQNNVQ